MDSNLPNDYRLLGEYKPIKNVIIYVTIPLFLLSFWLCTHLNSIIRPEFDGFDFLSKLLLEADFIAKLKAIGLIALILYGGYGTIHEAIHGLFYWRFTHRRPLFGCRKGNYYTALPIGIYCSRNQAVVAMLSPLFIIAILGLILWPFVPITVIPVVILLVSANIGASLSDMLQARWLISYSSESRYGYNGKHSVVYGPNEVEQ